MERVKPQPTSIRRFLYNGFHISLEKYTVTPPQQSALMQDHSEHSAYQRISAILVI